MWKSRSDEKNVSSTSAQTSLPQSPVQPPAPKETPTSKTGDPFRNDVAHIGKSVLIRGELSGSEDLYLDGEVEGSIDLREHSLVIGPNGRIKAGVSAREIVLHGKVEGNVRATERVELKKSSALIGDVTTQRIVIEDGAFFKGAIDIPKDKDAKMEPRKPVVPVLNNASIPQNAFVEQK